MAVQVPGPKGRAPLAARVIVLALPPAEDRGGAAPDAQERPKLGYTPSAEALATASCLMLITSLGPEDWPAERVLALYGPRLGTGAS